MLLRLIRNLLLGFLGFLIFSTFFWPLLESAPRTQHGQSSVATPAAPVPPARNADGWPTPQTAAESLATECARAVGIDPRGTISAKQFGDLAMCLDLVKAALTK
jgi:hypothetical protein